MPYEGEFGLIYENKDEERLFLQTRRLNGFHIGVVKAYFEEEAYQSISGEHWYDPEPKGRGRLGHFGMNLRYACLDHWYRDQAIKDGKITSDEVSNFWAAWRSKCRVNKSLSHAELLKHWRDNRKSKAARSSTNKRKRERRRTKTWQRNFQAERDPNLIYRRLRATMPTTSTMDDQILRAYARMLAEANDLLWQAEQIKCDDGVVPEERLQDYAKLIDLNNKIQKQVADLLKSHGYDYQARRSRRETQTAAEVFDDFVEQAAVLFDQRAVELVCKKCELSLGYFIRHFPTVEFTLSTPDCPRCNSAVQATLYAEPDEVVDA